MTVRSDETALATAAAHLEALEGRRLAPGATAVKNVYPKIVSININFYFVDLGHDRYS